VCGLAEQPEEQAIRGQHLTALDEREPLVERLRERRVDRERLGVGRF
jgi:hypothetical protein